MITLVQYLLKEEYIALVLNDQTRALLFDHFPPKYKDFIGHHVTLKFGVPKDADLPGQPKDVKVVGYADDGDSIEALVVSVDGETKRVPMEALFTSHGLLTDQRVANRPIQTNC